MVGAAGASRAAVEVERVQLAGMLGMNVFVILMKFFFNEVFLSGFFKSCPNS